MKLSNITSKALNYQLLSALTEDNNELEVVFQNDTIDLNTFIRLIQRLKSKNYDMVNDGIEQLDIFIYRSNLRLSIKTKQAILNFCKSNQINESQVAEKTYKKKYKWNEKTERELQKVLNLRNIPTSFQEKNYGFKINLKNELTYENLNNIKDEDLYFKLQKEENKFFNSNIFTTEKKTFRYKKRYSFITPNKNFRIDLSIVKQSEQYYHNGSYRNKLFRNLIESKVLNSVPKYEIEIEYIGKKYEKTSLKINKTYFGKGTIVSSIKLSLLKEIGSILQTLQQSFYIIGRKEEELVREAYFEYMNTLYKKKINIKLAIFKEIQKILNKEESMKQKKQMIEDVVEEYNEIFGDFYNQIKLMSDDKTLLSNLNIKTDSEINRYESLLTKKKFNRKFFGPKPVTLEMSNLDKDDPVCVLTDYTVTDKADGSGNLLFVLNFNEFTNEQVEYLLNRYLTKEEKNSSNLVKIKSDILKRVSGKAYMIDSNFKIIFTGLNTNESKVYLMNGEWMTKNKNGKLMFHYELYDSYVYDGFDTTYYPLMKSVACNNPSNNTQSRINYCQRFTKLMKGYLSKQNKLFQINVKLFDIVTGDNDIFSIAKNIWENGTNNYQYHLDGLILTPASKPVAYTKISDSIDLENIKLNDYDLEFGRTWIHNLKWKPKEDNSIDFLLQLNKDCNGNEKISHIMNYNTNKMESYKTGILYCGDNIKGLYKKRRFIPINPYDPDAFNISIPVDSENNILSLDNIPIQDNTIIECIYNLDNSIDVSRRWKVLRTRHDKTLTYNKGIQMKYQIIGIYKRMFTVDKIFLDILESFMENYTEQIDSYKSIDEMIRKARNQEDVKAYFGIIRKICETFVNNNLLNKLSVNQNKFKLQNKSQYSEWEYYMKSTVKMFKQSIKNFSKKSSVYDLYNSSSDLEGIVSVLSSSYNIKLLTNFDETLSISIQFGNNYKTANNVWKNIHQPITEETMFTGKNIIPRQEYYYKNDLSAIRNNSPSINIRLFHNFVKGYMYDITSKYLLQSTNTINMLELACGKGQDLFKYAKSNISNVVAIDIIRDNIENNINGANLRYINLKEEKNYEPNVTFLVGDVSKKISNLEAFKSNTITEKLYYDKASSIFKNTNFQFDMISIQFAVHYMFENMEKINTFCENIDENLKLGGLFMGTCFDGQIVWEHLKQKHKNEFIEGVDPSGKLLWKIIKKYKNINVNGEDIFPVNELSLGNVVSVYVNSINALIDEYLVNFEYFKNLLAEKNILPVKQSELKDLYVNRNIKSSIESFDGVYKDMYTKELSDPEKTFSFMNKYFIFKKYGDQKEEIYRKLKSDILTTQQLYDLVEQNNVNKLTNWIIANYLSDSSISNKNEYLEYIMAQLLRERQVILIKNYDDIIHPENIDAVSEQEDLLDDKTINILDNLKKNQEIVENTNIDYSHSENIRKIRKCLHNLKDTFHIYNSFLSGTKATLPGGDAKKYIKWQDIQNLFMDNELFKNCFDILDTASENSKVYDLLDIDVLSIEQYKMLYDDYLKRNTDKKLQKLSREDKKEYKLFYNKIVYVKIIKLMEQCCLDYCSVLFNKSKVELSYLKAFKNNLLSFNDMVLKDSLDSEDDKALRAVLKHLKNESDEDIEYTETEFYKAFSIYKVESMMAYIKLLKKMSTPKSDKVERKIPKLLITIYETCLNRFVKQYSSEHKTMIGSGSINMTKSMEDLYDSMQLDGSVLCGELYDFMDKSIQNYRDFMEGEKTDEYLQKLLLLREPYMVNECKKLALKDNENPLCKDYLIAVNDLKKFIKQKLIK